MSVARPRAVTVSPFQSIPTFFRMLLRAQLTKGRLAALVVLGLISIVLAAVSRLGDDAESAVIAVMTEYSIGLHIPLSALLLATPMIGNLIEDRLLAYFWLKPVPRWHLAVGAFGASVVTLIPTVVLPVAIAAGLSGRPGLIVPAIFAAILGIIAYSAMDLFLGARFAVGLWIGLFYIIAWENLLARSSDGLARTSIRSYLLTVFERGTGTEIELANRATWAMIAIPLLVAVAAVGLTAWTLQRRDVD